MTVTGTLVGEVMRLRAARPHHYWSVYVAAPLYTEFYADQGPLLEDAKGQTRWLDGVVIPFPMADGMEDVAILQSHMVVDANTIPPLTYGGEKPSYLVVFHVPPSQLTRAQADVYRTLRQDGVPLQAAVDAAQRLA